MGGLLDGGSETAVKIRELRWYESFNWAWFWRYSLRDRLVSWILRHSKCSVCGWSLDPFAHHNENLHNESAEGWRRAKAAEDLVHELEMRMRRTP